MGLRPSTRLPNQDIPKVIWAYAICCRVSEEPEAGRVLAGYSVRVWYLSETKLPPAFWFLGKETQESELKGFLRVPHVPLTGEEKVGPGHTLHLLCSLDVALPAISSSFIYYLP